MISAVLFLVFYFLTFREKEPEAEQAVQIVFFGDSLFGIARDESSIPAQVGALLDKSVYNAALGGTCVGRLDREPRLDSSGDSLSFAALTKALYMEDFRVQKLTAGGKNAGADYFAETVRGLEQIDFASVEMVLVQYGTNDNYAGMPILNEKDPYDEYTFAGALRKSLIMLQRKNPDMRIILATPTYSWMVEWGQTCEEVNAGSGILEDYVSAEKAVAEELGIEVIDLYHDLYPHEQWSDWELYSFDGLHPNEAGRTLIAEKIAGYLKGEEK